PVRRGQPVDAREEVEEVAAEPALGDLGDGGPRLAGDADPQIAVLPARLCSARTDVIADEGVAQLGAEAPEDRLAGLVAGRLVGLVRGGERSGAALRRRQWDHPSIARRDPHGGCAPATGRCLRAAPRAAAGNRARTRRRARADRRPWSPSTSPSRARRSWR